VSYVSSHILHQHQKPGFLRLLQPESLDSSLINPVFQVLLRKVQDVSHGKAKATKRLATLAKST
jgi:hypothetical protein